MVLFRVFRHVKFTFNLKCYSTEVKRVTMKYLNVAEKNDAAKNIAQLLSRGSSTRREGLSQYNKIYEFDCTVLGEQVRMVMTSVSGHLLNYAFTGPFRNWQSCNPVSLFDAPIVKVCNDNYLNIKKTLEREIRSCEGLIIWTDCDREGENIGFEIINVCTDVKPNIRIYRAKFSEITGASVQRALHTLGQPNKNISDAVDVRQELDLRTGAAFTRLQTLRLQKVFPQKLSDKLISYGSCQFPTLGFVVERYQAIEDFIDEPFWRIKMSHTVDGLTTDFNWKRDRLFDKNSCEAILDICRENPLAKVESVEGKEKSKWRPLPLDTVEMEKNVSRKLRINAKDTMQIAERLYSQGFISYPRTETNIFPKELNLANLVQQQLNDASWGTFAQRIIDDGGPNPRQGSKSDQAHPPIHPIKYTNSLGGNDKRLYEYIVRHFLACLHEDAKGFETTVIVDIAEEKFTGKGFIVLEKNYLDVYIYETWIAKEINNYRAGDTFTPTLLDMVDSSTTPPKLLTEADLIALMEKHGIGTDATHADHIDKIKSREYVGLYENIYFVPGTLGMGLVEGYNNVGLEVSLAKPTLRAEFENDLKLICDGLKNPDEVRRDQIAKYRAVFQTVAQRMRQIDESLGNRLDDRPADVADNEVISNNDDFRPALKCPKCGSDMIVRTKRNGPGQYIVCTNAPVCRHVIWFPGAVETIEVQDQHCPQCGPNFKNLKLKFKQNLFPGYPNPNILCIGGCDMNVLETLDINLSSVNQRNTDTVNNRVINNPVNNDTNANNTRRNSDSGHSSTRRESNWLSSNFPNQSASNRTLDAIPGPSRISNTSNISNNVEPGGEIVCSCNQEAVLLTVRKEGPNQGRQFYGCATRACQFFLWALEEGGGTTRDNQLNPSSTSTVTSTLKCNCRQPAVLRTVSKAGPNTGRQFYCCPKPMGQGCGFFKWADEAGGHGNHSGGGDDGFGGGGGGGGSSNWNTSGSNSFVQRRKTTNKSKNRPAPYKNQTKGKRKCGICGEEGNTDTVNNRVINNPVNNDTNANNTRSNSDSSHSSTRRESNWLSSNFPNQSASNRTLDAMPGPSRTSNTSNISNNVEPGGEIVCNCNQEAVLLTVRKEGPNQGRQFYGCATRACHFFLWAPEEGGGTTRDNQLNPSSTSTVTSTLKCNCRQPAVRRTVSKAGPNTGRKFYCCPKPMGQGCGFYKWVDEAGGGVNHSGGGDDGFGGGGGGGGSSNWNSRGSNSFVQRRKTTNNSKNGAAPYKNQTKGKRKCGICGEEGHTRLKCPNK